MAIRITLDAILRERGLTALELADYVGITPANMSLLRSGKVKGVRFSTLNAICKRLNCQPADLLLYVSEGEED